MCEKSPCRTYILMVLILFMMVYSVEVYAMEGDMGCHFSMSSDVPDQKDDLILSPITYRYRVTYDESCHINVIKTEKAPMECGPVHQEMKPAELMSQLSTQIEVICQSLRPGVFFLPPISVELSDSKGETAIFHPAIHPIHLYTTHDSQKYEILSSLEFRLWKSNIYIYILLLTAMIMVAGIVAIVIVRRHAIKHETKVENEIKLSPFEAFQMALTRLVDENPQNLEENKCFHDALSEALRKYLSSQIEFDAMNCTTHQLCEKLEKELLPPSLVEEAERILLASDHVKFAPEGLGVAENVLLVRDTRLLGTAIEAYFVEKARETEQLAELKKGKRGQERKELEMEQTEEGDIRSGDEHEVQEGKKLPEAESRNEEKAA